ncbi:hypothetical protein BH10PLA1_BH10PLA1_06470 [soil metagenome]
MLRIRSRAFTLIELLIVIAIISVIVAILLPCIKMVREQALALRCVGNLRQVGIALNNYAADYRGTIPNPGWMQTWIQGTEPGKPTTKYKILNWHDLLSD